MAKERKCSDLFSPIKAKIACKKGLLIVNSDNKNVVPKKELRRTYQKHIQLHVIMRESKQKMYTITCSITAEFPTKLQLRVRSIDRIPE